MKFLIASDSFKGSLSAEKVCRKIEEGIKNILPCSSAVCFPLADGGEGTVDSFFANCGGRMITAETVNCFFEPIHARYLMTDSGTAVIETAAASGIVNIPAERLNPMRASTYGTGLLIKDAVENGAQNIILGLGGSATNDGGTGVLSALGIDFFDADSNILEPVGESLVKISDFSQKEAFGKYSRIKFTLACDVENVFCGKEGAAYVFARQKGADEKQTEQLDRGLDNLAGLINDKLKIDLRKCKGAGAAGGLAGGLAAFLDCEIKPGFSVLSEAAEFERYVAEADVVITGEGRTDSQTSYGKLPLRVSELSKKHSKPCILVCGQLAEDVDIKKMGFVKAFVLTEKGVTPDTAIKNASEYLVLKGEEIAKMY